MEQKEKAGQPAAARQRGWLPALVVLVLMAGLPVAVWLDLRTVSENALRRQAGDLDSAISSIRGYYAGNVVDRVLALHQATQVTDNYEAIPGAIPIPATLSIELGKVIGAQQKNITYRFVSDLPFDTRAAHVLDQFEKDSLAALRAQPNQQLTDVSWSANTNRVRIITPVIMGSACVQCHNTHPRSPKRDWKVGDVRGIQEIGIVAPIVTSWTTFKYLPAYFVLVGIAGALFIALQGRQARALAGLNTQLQGTNEFLASISAKISRYLSPQIYASIFSGQKDGSIHTERKKLTIFFSDIKDFTSTTERLQPEAITALLNEYFTEMSAIALKHGGTIDKFIGDAMLVFFGDPETRGAAEDAKACVRMAVEMQRRLTELSIKWRNEGIEQPFRARMGINTGYCNVGNFGSAERMDYTIIGGEANLAARLQSSADVGSIVISYETWALVRDIVAAHPLPPISMKGIGREVEPYLVDGLTDGTGTAPGVFHEELPGLTLYLDPRAVNSAETERVTGLLREALDAVEGRSGKVKKPPQ
jgi:class 3 adenylate cyclase